MQKDWHAYYNTTVDSYSGTSNIDTRIRVTKYLTYHIAFHHPQPAARHSTLSSYYYAKNLFLSLSLSLFNICFFFWFHTHTQHLHIYLLSFSSTISFNNNNIIIIQAFFNTTCDPINPASSMDTVKSSTIRGGYPLVNT